jgi:hypothetical protein
VEPIVRARVLRCLATPRLHLHQACSSHHRGTSFKVCEISADKINMQLRMDGTGTRSVGADDLNVGSCDPVGV